MHTPEGTLERRHTSLKISPPNYLTNDDQMQEEEGKDVPPSGSSTPPPPFPADEDCEDYEMG